jgi:hypothetical protein
VIHARYNGLNVRKFNPQSLKDRPGIDLREALDRNKAMKNSYFREIEGAEETRGNLCTRNFPLGICE